MSSIAEKLALLAQTKSAIKAAIEAQGVTVGDIPFSQYPDKIAAIGGPDISAYYLTLAQTFLEVGAAASGDSIDIDTNGTPLVSDSPDWISAIIEDGALALESIAENTSTESRTGDVVLTLAEDSNVTATLTVEQLGAEVTEYYITANGQTATSSASKVIAYTVTSESQVLEIIVESNGEPFIDAISGEFISAELSPAEESEIGSDTTPYILQIEIAENTDYYSQRIADVDLSVTEDNSVTFTVALTQYEASGA